MYLIYERGKVESVKHVFLCEIWTDTLSCLCMQQDVHNRNGHRLRMINVRKTSGIREQETLELLRKLRNWEFHDLHPSFYIAEVINPPSPKKSLAKYVARIGSKEMHMQFN